MDFREVPGHLRGFGLIYGEPVLSANSIGTTGGTRNVEMLEANDGFGGSSWGSNPPMAYWAIRRF